MKPCAFEYHRPGTLDEAVLLLQRHGGAAKLLAGGQSLIPAMNFRLARPAVLIDLNSVTELDYTSPEGPQGLRLGAMTRQRALERSAAVAQHAPLLHESMPFIAHPQIRNRGTIGGSIAHADPAAELPAVMRVLAARFQVRGPGGTRWVQADEFFTGLFTTALQPDEVLVEVVIPHLPGRAGWAFGEVARRHGDYALVGAAVVVVLDARGHCQQVRIGLLSVGDGPVLAERAARSLIGQMPSPEAIRAAADAASREDIDPPSDINASAAYRRHLAGVLVRRLLPRAVERAQQLMRSGP